MTPTGTVSELRSLTLAATMARFGMRKVAITGEFQRRRGDWNGRPLTLVTDIFEGDGRLARLHVAAIEGDESMATLTVLALPRSETGSAVLGADLVAFGGAFSTTIFDLLPTTNALDAEARESVTAARARLELASEPGERTLPAPLTGALFSEWVTMVKPRLDADAILRSTYAAYLEAFVGCLVRAEPSQAAVEPAQRVQRQLLERLAGVKKQMRALSKLFGASWTTAYFDGVFLAQDAVS